MKIEAYDFGTITIDGETYTSDLKIVNDIVISHWWRIQGHTLLMADIEDIIAARPDIVVVGTGYSGLMSISQEVRKRLSEETIELISKPTREACDEFNNLSSKRNVAFAVHLTC